MFVARTALLLICSWIAIGSNASAVSYEDDIRPIFDSKCVACHACYDAPCQLNLTDPAGVQRGAIDTRVYGDLRMEQVALTRLFQDADTEQQWRSKGFTSVLGQDSASSLLWAAVDHGAAHPLATQAAPPDELDLGIERASTCPVQEEYAAWADDNPTSGMPFAMARLDEQELQSIKQWLDEGAPVDTVSQAPTAAEQAEIDRWEAFLNQTGPRERLVARYLYEHLFLANLSFEEEARPHDFRLVRSATPPGTDIVELATRRPNEASPLPAHYYRFELIQGTRIRKSHLPFPLSQAYLDDLDRLFLGRTWSTDADTATDWDDGLNPVIAYADIPQQARYTFLIERSWFFISNFIRGPVCHGPIALGVIQDRFWVSFLDPDADLDETFLYRSRNQLDLPGDIDSFSSFTQQARKRSINQRRYLKRKNRELHRQLPEGRSMDDLWDGHENSRLTVFRHRDSSTVVRDWIGEDPDTLWVMDYSTLERTYYNLVANFDVFGNTYHQTATRIYFDYIRAESEDNFLLFLPEDERTDIRQQWYRGLAAKKKQLQQYRFAGRDLPVDIAYGDDPKFELLRAFELPSAAPRTDLSATNAAVLEHTRLLATEPQPAVRQLPETTVVHVVVDGTIEGDLVYTITRDRAHSNTAFMLREGARLEPKKDKLTVVPEVLGDYPNRIFRVPESDIDRFFERLRQLDGADEYTALVQDYGLFRTDPALFDEAEWLYRRDASMSPLTAGRLDLSRYGGELTGPTWMDWAESLPVPGRRRVSDRASTQ